MKRIWTILTLAAIICTGTQVWAQHNVKHPKGAAKKEPVSKIANVTVDNHIPSVVVHVKNGRVYVNDSPLMKTSDFCKGEEIVINYKQHRKEADEPSHTDQPRTNAERPRLGVYTIDFFDEGALVQDIMIYSPADRIGIRPGDVILRVNGYDINSADDLMDAIGRFNPGDEVSISFRRLRTIHTATATLEERQKYHEAERDRYPKRWWW